VQQQFLQIDRLLQDFRGVPDSKGMKSTALFFFIPLLLAREGANDDHNGVVNFYAHFGSPTE
jgi:hypothetical protein